MFSDSCSSCAAQCRLISLQTADPTTLEVSSQPKEFAGRCRELGDGDEGQITVDMTWVLRTTSHTFNVVDLEVFQGKALWGKEQWTNESSSHYGPGNRLLVSGGISDFDFFVLRSRDEISGHAPQGKKHTSRKRFSINRHTLGRACDRHRLCVVANQSTTSGLQAIVGR